MGKHKSGIDLYRAASKIEKKPERKAEKKPKKSASDSVGKSSKNASATPLSPTLPFGSLLKTTGPEKDSSGKTSGSKAARLLLLLGTDEAASVMSRLKPEEAEEVARQIAVTRHVDSVEAKELLDEFGDSFADLEVRRAKGGVEAARNILTEAFGPEKAEKIIAAAVPEALPRPFDFLSDLNFNQLSNLLRKESPTTLALVLVYLDPAQASRILESVPDEERAAIVLRMARTEKVHKDVLDTVETTLRDKLRLIGKDDSEEMDGRSALADILRFMDLSDERRLLDELEENDSGLADQVKEKLYTMDSVLHLRDKDLQQILFDMDEKAIAVILKGQTPEVKERLTDSLSSRRRILVADEGDMLGPMPRSEVDTAVREFLNLIRKGEEEGTYIILREESDLIE